MVEWHHQLNEHEFEQTLGNGEGQGRLVCCSPWGRKESNTTERLNYNNKNLKGFPGASVGKESICNAGDLRSVKLKFQYLAT